ncbi:MAG: peptidylprolyl isomerase [Bryobacteraceae bacterium]|nr:peptidylprolyl isomerase [Bryobacteraceae bacterium]
MTKRSIVLFLFTSALFAQSILNVPEATPEQAKKRRNGLYAVLHTSKGPITIQLFERESPLTVENFVALATGQKQWRDPVTKQLKQTPLYNGTIFHRVIPGFVIQGGDPSGTGVGDVGFTIPDEWNRSSMLFNIPGRVAMANFGPNTAASQFFITERASFELDERYTIFGQVVDGSRVVSAISGVPRDSEDRPKEKVVLERVEVFRVGPPPKPRK